MKAFRSASPLFALSALLSVTACVADSPDTPCPAPAVLEQAQTVTTFLPGRQDVAAEIATARITGVAGDCVLHKKKHLLDVTFRAGFSATNGPANKQTGLTLPYAVWVTEGDTIVSETDYTITLKFTGNETTTQATSKPIKIALPGDFDSNLQILVGFKMTQAQLDYAASHPSPGS